MSAVAGTAATAAARASGDRRPAAGGAGAAGSPAGPTAREGRVAPRTAQAARGLWRAVAPLVVSAVVAAVAWYGSLWAFDVNPLIGKTPTDVAAYLFSGPDAAAHRAAVVTPMGQTLFDAGVGFVVGMGAALVLASLFVLWTPAERSFMPLAMLLRSVPLVAMTPVILLVFGRGLVGTAVIGGIVVFFPALVLVVTGLRAVSGQTRDLVAAYGGGEGAVLRLVAIPTAMPSLLAAARISVPGALTGALVAEWLGTGRGVGSSILNAIGGFRYDELWASITVLTATSVVLYTLVGLVEQAVLARYAPHARR